MTLNLVLVTQLPSLYTIVPPTFNWSLIELFAHIRTSHLDNLVLKVEIWKS